MHPYPVTPLAGGSVSSPNASAFPQVLTPATSSTVNKPLAPMPGMANQPPISLHKQWVLPPKPKPGRKPAVDTPPTKRKAQNREAQRAFRERRAAKVGELEEEMKRMEEEDRKEQEELRARIKQLESNVEDYSHMVMTWGQKYREMEMAYGREKQLREAAEGEIEMLRKGMANGTEAVALPARQPTQNGYVGAQSAKQQDDSIVMEPISDSCGACTKDRCQCIEEAFEMGGLANEDTAPSSSKRPHSPTSATDNKRPRQVPDLDDNVEIDFTAQFATPRKPTLATSASTSSLPAIAPPDPCGFCSNGGTCICAEISKEKSQFDEIKPPSLLPTSNQEPTTGVANSDPCVNGPGTCKQCLSNPTSTLFCKSIAASRTSVASGTDQPQGTTTSTQPEPDASPGITLTCADAFITLSRHPAFNRASSDLGSWVPRLAAVRKPASRPDRTAYDIEAATVLGVLKYFDLRFGEDAVEAGTSNRTGDGEAASLPNDTNGNGASSNEEEAKSWVAYEPGA